MAMAAMLAATWMATDRQLRVPVGEAAGSTNRSSNSAKVQTANATRLNTASR
jgi:hypothetical protein